MKRVVDRPPDPEEMEASGLKKSDYRIDAETYRHFSDRYRREFEAFFMHFRPPEPGGRRTGSAPGSDGNDEGASGKMDPEEREACLAAFEEGLPPYHYRLGVFYRYRVDRSGREDRPILLDGYEREEITGWIGIPPGPYHRSILMELVYRIGDWLRGKRTQK